MALAAVFVGALALNGWALNEKDGKNELLVTVEGVKITQGDVDQKVDAYLGARAGSLTPDQLAQIRGKLDQRVLENLIVETLLTKAVQEKQITLEKDAVEEAMAQLKTSLPPDTDFEDYLKTIGFSKKKLSEAISKDLKIKKLLEAQVADIPNPTDAEIEQFYQNHLEQFKTPEGKAVRHILIAVSPDDDAAKRKEKRAKAEKIRRRLVDNKEDFAAVAKEVSDGPSKTKGGDLGVVTKGSTVKPFEDAVFSQKVGEIGPVVETEFGYHIILVVKDQKEETVPLATVKASISDYLTSQKKEEAIKAYVDSLRDKAKIVYHDKQHKTPEPKNPA